ncbi:MAG TPA: lasso RiPP family leader peptide-containing protein [Thermoanaerobaculia bacterium]|nr:lasso RiPP family leader peptide-containing protein [Thermoanaerobaculia bacterium]
MPYRPPRLVSYGRLADVTQFGGSDVNDSGSNLGAFPGGGPPG